MKPPIETGRRDALLRAKLKALVRSRWGEVVDHAEEGPFLGGATLRDGVTGWVLAEDVPARALGGTVAWALRAGLADVHLLAADATGTLARRSAYFRRPPTVWRIDGTALVPAEPEPLAPEPPLDPADEALRPLIEQAGADAVVEGGILRAEVRGLEVARVENGRLAVGVGTHDREAQRELRGKQQGFDELFEVVRAVAQYRTADGVGHAAYPLSSERWLRSVIVGHPDLVGARELHPVPSPVPRDDLRQPAPAPAAGVDAEGRPVLAVCSVGIDPDLVAAAADAWLRDGREPRLVLVVPQGDDHPMLHRAAAELLMPTQVVTVPREWRRL